MATSSKRNCCSVPPEKEDIDTNMILKLKLKPLLRKKKISVADEDKIITNILSRLPMKTLLRFKSVSKSRLSIISNRDFITTHLSGSIDNPHLRHHHLILCDAPFLPQKYHRYIDFIVRHENLKLVCCPVDYLLNGTGLNCPRNHR